MSFSLKAGMLPLFESASEVSIEHFEKVYGYDLPLDYRHFLREANGFRKDTSLDTSLFFPIKGRWIKEHKQWEQVVPPFIWPPVGEVFDMLVGEPWGLKGLSHTAAASDIGNSNSLVAEEPGYGFASRMPKHYLVIGDTTMNELICLECTGESVGRLFLWNSDFDPDSNAEEAVERLVLIADTFQEFWDSLLLLNEREMVRY